MSEHAPIVSSLPVVSEQVQHAPLAAGAPTDAKPLEAQKIEIKPRVPATSAAAGLRLEKLSPSQIKVMELLVNGQSIVEAARSCGVGRSTVYDWINQDPFFREAYNIWRRELLESARTRLLAMSDEVVEAIQEKIQTGDTRAILTVAKGLRLLETEGLSY